MVDTSEKSVSAVGGAMNRKKDPDKRAMRGVVVFAVIIVLVSVVYLLVSSKGHIPELPRTQLNRDAQAQIRAKWADRTAHFKMTDQERELAGLLNQVHGLETATEVDRDALRDALGRFSKKAAVVVGENKERYLLLGDYLALDFQQALLRALADVARDGLESNEETTEEIRNKGGAFWTHALRRGVIDERGRLHVWEVTPAVLFRVRWRHLAGLDMEESFSTEELRLYYDFVVAFTTPDSVETRLSAITRLKALDGSFDDVLARAMVFHQGGRGDEAYQELKKAMDGGRRDTQTVNFFRALR